MGTRGLGESDGVEDWMARNDGAGAGSVLLAFILGARDAGARAAEAAAKSREVLNQGRETLTTAIERGRQAYQQARTNENA